MNEWVPWCWTGQMFQEGRYISITQGPGDQALFNMWQHARGDGDLVRVSRLEDAHLFSDDAPRINGYAYAGGDRILILREDNTLYLDLASAPAAELQDYYLRS